MQTAALIVTSEHIKTNWNVNRTSPVFVGIFFLFSFLFSTNKDFLIKSLVQICHHASHEYSVLALTRPPDVKLGIGNSNRFIQMPNFVYYSRAVLGIWTQSMSMPTSHGKCKCLALFSRDGYSISWCVFHHFWNQ